MKQTKKLITSNLSKIIVATTLAVGTVALAGCSPRNLYAGKTTEQEFIQEVHDRYGKNPTSEFLKDYRHHNDYKKLKEFYGDKRFTDKDLGLTYFLMGLINQEKIHKDLDKINTHLP